MSTFHLNSSLKKSPHITNDKQKGSIFIGLWKPLSFDYMKCWPITYNGVQLNVMKVGAFPVNCKVFCVGQLLEVVFPRPALSILHPAVLHFSLSARKAFVVLKVRVSGDAVIGLPSFAITLPTTTLFHLLVGCVLYSPGTQWGNWFLGSILDSCTNYTLGALK